MVAGILLGFLMALLYCAIVIFVAFLFVWGLRFVGVNIDGNVCKWGQIIVWSYLRHHPADVAAWCTRPCHYIAHLHTKAALLKRRKGK